MTHVFTLFVSMKNGNHSPTSYYQIAKNQLEWKFLLWYENQDAGRNNEGTRAIYYNSPHDHGRHPYIFLPGANLWASVKIPLHTQETPSEKKC